MAHSFARYCIEPHSLVRGQTLKTYLRALLKQSNQPLAITVYRDTEPLQDNGKTIRAPRYFGAGGEFLSECFFEVYGDDYNIKGITSLDDEEKQHTDGGVDQTALSRKDKIYREYANTKSKPNSPVYIQVKTTMNSTREYQTNDGSRIMNYFAHAQALARVGGHSYCARYVLFTTGKGLHWALERNTLKMIEVINARAIERRIDGDTVFWNHMRARLGIELLSQTVCDPDGEYQSVIAEIAQA